MANTNDWSEALKRLLKAIYGFSRDRKFEAVAAGRASRKDTIELYRVAREYSRDLETYLYRKQQMDPEAFRMVKEIAKKLLPAIENCFGPAHYKRLRSKRDKIEQQHAQKQGEPAADDLTPRELSEIRAVIDKEFKPLRVQAEKAAAKRTATARERLWELCAELDALPGLAVQEPDAGQSEDRSGAGPAAAHAHVDPVLEVYRSRLNRRITCKSQRQEARAIRQALGTDDAPAEDTIRTKLREYGFRGSKKSPHPPHLA